VRDIPIAPGIVATIRLSTCIAILLLTFSQGGRTQDRFDSGGVPNMSAEQARRCAEERLRHYADEPFKQPSACPQYLDDNRTGDDRYGTNSTPPAGRRQREGSGATGGRGPAATTTGGVPKRDTSPPPCMTQLTLQEQKELRLSAEEAIRTFASMGEQADIIVTTMGTLAASHLIALTKPHQPLDDIANTAIAVVRYTVNGDHRAEVHKQLWKDLQKGLEFARNNPALAAGIVGDQILVGKATASSVRVCDAVMKTPMQLKAEVTNTKKALDTLLLKGEQQAKTPPIEMGKAMCGSSVNPTWGQFNCVPSSIAYDMRRETGFLWVAEHFNWKQKDAPYTFTEFGDMLRALYKGRTYRGMAPDRLKDQLSGIATPMTRKAMEDELRSAGPGARGLVAVVWPDGSGGHLFHVERMLDRIDYHDPQGGFTDERAFIKLRPMVSGLRPGQERVYFFRTGGPDLIP